MSYWKILVSAAALAAVAAAQSVAPESEARGAPLKLVPAKPLTEPRVSKPAEESKAQSESGARPAILKLKPAGDPVYLENEPAGDTERDKWRTYQRPKVERFSRDGERVAIRGYDVVSYLDRRAGKGRKEFSVEYGGVTWYFESAEHRDAFRQDPESYLPEYGGFCAYSVGRGYPATADPRAFAMEGHKLYLFFDKAVQFVWEQDRARMIATADRYWPQLHR